MFKALVLSKQDDAVAVNGYANGWLVTPPPGGAPVSLELEWTPQRTVWRGMFISAASIIA